MSIITIKDVYKEYETNKSILKGLNLEIDQGEFIVLVGPSGCGKTTLLKMINKLIPVTSGEIYVEGKNIEEWNTIKLRSSIGYVIQQIGLFPHMTIENNIGYVPSIKGMKKEAYNTRVSDLIHLVGMNDTYLDRYPSELSGGQRQRIGVARALASDPDIILMDEPFGAVDEIARRHLQDELKEIHKKLKKTIVFVTHDIEEALKLGTKIVLMHNGKIEQVGTPEEVVFKPKTPFVKDFFGIKGFKARLDEEALEKIFNQVINGERPLSEVLQ
ncbi:ABC transporter ATP-binding protein [Haloplasma contractile]|uniref:ABC-type quaternary amine transporter n=1 Tax=Haloplasma contractile SSD-17B TaxID=1033810 RepID=U2EAL4_9MOLU|nr:ATP-binding cassette domain-containing protein [Haloplasma contractile]ERJ12143.1 Proline-glycine betaine ABC-type transport system ATPase component protein [Haloplasma contractile SSD-17B]